MNHHGIPSDDLGWLEQMLNCRIAATKIRALPQLYPSYTHDSTSVYEATYVPQYEQEYSVTICSRDLEYLIRKFKEVDAQEHAQRRWPHLRQAYLEYITQVQLTAM
mgnify:CR=1 FL=1|jgi:hypothetical protein